MSGDHIRQILLRVWLVVLEQVILYILKISTKFDVAPQSFCENQHFEKWKIYQNIGLGWWLLSEFFLRNPSKKFPREMLLEVQ